MPIEEIDITSLLSKSPVDAITSKITTTTETKSDKTDETVEQTQTKEETEEKAKPITLDNLMAVDNALKNDKCKSIQDIMNETGLDETTVARCIEFLVDHGLAANSGIMYCGVRAVEKLISQLRALK